MVRLILLNADVVGIKKYYISQHIIHQYFTRQENSLKRGDVVCCSMCGSHVTACIHHLSADFHRHGNQDFFIATALNCKEAFIFERQILYL